MTKFRFITLNLLTLILFFRIYAQGQDSETIDFYNKIQDYDLSKIIIADSIVSGDREDSQNKYKRAEILGFIGDNFQRFQIHFISIIKNPTNPYEYFASGKTRVKDNICSFHGTITVKKAKLYKNGDSPTCKQGSANSEIILYEDKKQNLTGIIKGKLESAFIINGDGQFRYDALSFDADGFSNNEFIGIWTSYSTNASQKMSLGRLSNTRLR